MVTNKDKKAEISHILPPILSCPNKKTIEKQKKQGKKVGRLINTSSFIKLKLYTQALAANINNVLKIKENFLSLSPKNVKKVYKIINNQEKIRINITTKGLSHC